MYKSLVTEKQKQHKKHSDTQITNININKTKAATKSVTSEWRFGWSIRLMWLQINKIETEQVS